MFATIRPWDLRNNHRHETVREKVTEGLKARSGKKSSDVATTSRTSACLQAILESSEVQNKTVNGIGVIHTCIYVHIYVHCIWLAPASFGSRHDLTLVVRSQTKRQQSAHSIKDQGLHSCHN